MDDFAAASNQTRNLKAELANGRTLRSTAASFLRGFRGYSTSRSIGHNSLCWIAGCVGIHNLPRKLIWRDLSEAVPTAPA